MQKNSEVIDINQIKIEHSNYMKLGNDQDAKPLELDFDNASAGDISDSAEVPSDWLEINNIINIFNPY